MKQSVIREMTLEELNDRLNEEVDGLSKLQLHHEVSPLENPLQLRFKRRTVARLKTELLKRERSAASAN